MGVVVYNPTDSPFITPSGQVDGYGWKYIEEDSSVSHAIAVGHLVVSTPPASTRDTVPRARQAFQALQEHLERMSGASVTNDTTVPEDATVSQYQSWAVALLEEEGLTEGSTVDDMREYARVNDINLGGAERKADIWAAILETQMAVLRDTEAQAETSDPEQEA